MKNTAAKALCILAAASLYLFAINHTQATSDPNETKPYPQYSTIGHGPSILLLHDSSADDLDWAQAAQELATRFEITLVDITAYLNDSQGVQRLRQTLRELGIDDARIAGSAQAERLALRYALSYPSQSHSFTLPHNSDDLQILAELFNSTPCTKS